MLNTLKDNPGSRAPRKRVGRGLGSGLGKTCGRGYKGQKSRSGVAIKGFEGGQNPIYRRLPKRGFRSKFDRSAQCAVNLEQLQILCDEKKIAKDGVVTLEFLKQIGLVKSGAKTLRILARGHLSAPLTVQADHFSAAARSAIESAKGTCHVASRDEDRGADRTPTS